MEQHLTTISSVYKFVLFLFFEYLILLQIMVSEKVHKIMSYGWSALNNSLNEPMNYLPKFQYNTEMPNKIKNSILKDVCTIYITFFFNIDEN